jgi:uroporphyrinogen-III synthase
MNDESANDETAIDETSGRPLTGRRIAVPETREAERLAAMLREAGAEISACPLVGIVDPADPAPVAAWLDRFIAAPPDDLVLYTGEGLHRLWSSTRRSGSEAPFLAALGRTRRVTRGPKPARALRQLGLKPDLRAEPATTDGLVALLAGHRLEGRRIGVQLYPEAEDRLVEFLRAAGAVPDPVVPYAYVSEAADDRVAALIDEMALGRIDAVAFTSASQVRRLFEVARHREQTDRLHDGLRKTAVAAVGPVVEAELRKRGVAAAIAPEETYFMKPLVSAIVAGLS